MQYQLQVHKCQFEPVRYSMQGRHHISTKACASPMVGAFTTYEDSSTSIIARSVYNIIPVDIIPSRTLKFYSHSLTHRCWNLRVPSIELSQVLLTRRIQAILLRGYIA